MKLLNEVTSIYDRIIGLLAALAAVALVFIMLLVGADVIMRYALNNPIENAVEIANHSLLVITFMGAAWVAKREGHVKVDIVLSRLNPEKQAFFNTISSIIVVIVCLVLTWYGARITWDYFQRGAFYATLLRFPLAPLMAIIFVGYLLLSIQFLRGSYGWLRIWRTRRSQGQRS